VWREETDINREHWIEMMVKDGVLSDLMFDVDVDLPCPEVISKIRKLIVKKLRTLQEMKEVPPPSISQCDWPVPCAFRSACWQFREPSEELGFTRILPPA
jgi:hypothetical protein